MPNKSKGPVQRAHISNTIVKGIRKAQADYCQMSGYWASEGPEYWITSYVARALWKQSGDCTVVAEGRSDVTRKEAGPKRGRPSKAVQNKRYDIVLYFSNGNPRAVIEIKNNQQPDAVLRDVKRVVDALKQSKLRFGAVGYCYAQREGEKKLAKEKVRDYANTICEGAIEHAAKDRFKVTLHKYIKVERDHAWSAGCVLVERKQGNTQRT